MFVYFNKEGVIKEIINDSSIRQGNANVNTVYFFIEGADPQTATDTNGMYYKALFFSLGRYTMYLLDEHGEPLPSIEGESFDITTVKMEVPYDKKKELKYFKYFTRYEMFQLPIPQEVLNYKGTVGLKFQMINNDAINTQGLVVFNIEGTSPDLEIAPDTAITIAEWNYLLANMLTPGDVYTKAEANSTFQGKLTAGDNITITEDNVISATGGGPGSRAEWGNITGNIEDQTDLQTELSGKQNTLTFDNTPTDGSSNPVTSDGIYDAVQNVREVAEGKCNTYILSYADTIASVKADIQQHSNVKVFNGSKIDITADVLNGTYDNATFGNANFNSQSNEIYCFQSPYYTYLIVRITGGYMILAYIDVYYKKKGDIYLVIETDVPDRWYGNEYTFYKLETSKIDLTNYAQLSGNNTFTGTNTFTQDIEARALVFNSGALWISGASGVQVGANLFPGAIGSLSLGTSYYPWKDIHLSDGIIFKYGSAGTIDWKLKVGGDYSFGFERDNVSLLSYITTQGFGFNGDVYSQNNQDLGKSGSPWKDLYLSGTAIFTTATDSNFITSGSYRLGIDSNSKGYIGEPNNEIRFYGNNIRVASPLIRPQTDGQTVLGVENIRFAGIHTTHVSNKYSSLLHDVNGDFIINFYGQNRALKGTSQTQGQTPDLGASSNKWKDLYLSGAAYLGNTIQITNSGSTFSITKRGDRAVEIKDTATNKGIIVSGTEQALYSVINGDFSLGTSNNKWNNLYLSGNLTDGTNSVSVAQIASGIGGTYRHIIYIEGSAADITIAVNLNSATPINTQAALANINKYVMGGTATLNEQSNYKVVAIDSIATAGSIVYLDETGQHTLNIVDIYQDIINQL